MQSPTRDLWPDHLPPSFFAALTSDAPSGPSPAEAADDAEQAQAGWRLLQALPDGVLLLDVKLCCRFANPAAQPLLRPHRTWEHVSGLSWHEVVDDDWIDALLPWIAPALQGESGLVRVQRERAGSSSHWEVTLLPDRCADGRVTGVFVLLRDVTALQQQQASLEHQQHDLQQRLQRQDAHLALQQARWQALSAALRDAAIFFLDADGAIQDWPASAQRLLGYAAADVLGTKGADAPERPHPLPPDTPQALERASLLGQSESTGWLRCADGRQLWAH